MTIENKIALAAEKIKQSSYTTAFTGAGISVESGIPSFRGENGLWEKYDPKLLELDFFYAHPRESWEAIVKIFYEFFDMAKPNHAHLALAELEKIGKLQAVITQNIDNLHRESGNKSVFEFHGNSKNLICTACHHTFHHGIINPDALPVLCPDCNGLVKPDFIFFGEPIPVAAYQASVEAANKSEVMIVIGTTGEVFPAAQIPSMAKSNGATIIEINLNPSLLTRDLTDIFLPGKASEMMARILNKVLKELTE